MALELFHFQHDGNDFTLPKRIKAGVLRKARNADSEMDMFFTIVELLASSEAQEALDDMEIGEFASTLKLWMQGATAPNSSSSSS